MQCEERKKNVIFYIFAVCVMMIIPLLAALAMYLCVDNKELDDINAGKAFSVYEEDGETYIKSYDYSAPYAGVFK